MEEIIDWLLEIEQLAGNTYRAATERFSEDKEFSMFLSGLANDEDTHFQLLEEAELTLMQKKDHPLSGIIVDQNTRDRIEAPLRNLNKRIKAASKISKQAVMKVFVAVEFTELNHLFQYVLNTLQQNERDIERTVSTMLTHIERIKTFLNQHSDVLDLSDLIQKLPTVGKDKLLIVEHNQPIQIFMAQALEVFGAIDTAANGQEALKKVEKNFFNLIISDIDMPVMSGLDFFQKAIDIQPNIAKNFLFCSRDLPPDAEALFKAYNVNFLKIPFAINQLHKAIKTVLTKNN